MMNTNTTFSEITTTVKDAVDYYEVVEKDTTLGDDIREAGRGVRLIRNTLGVFPAQQPTIIPQVQLSSPTAQVKSAAKVPSAVEPLLKNCYNDAKAFKDLFQKVSQEKISQIRVQLYWNFLRENHINNLAETVTLNLMQNTYQLAEYYKIEKEKLKALDDAIKVLQRHPNTQTNGSHSYTNNGTGTQNNVTTGGTQNNTSGNGTNLSGATFNGGVSFGKN
ncbi:hypothetical protein GGI42DRAFT_364335 [Trichoderma sp. SZMC 28013]